MLVIPRSRQVALMQHQYGEAIEPTPPSDLFDPTTDPNCIHNWRLEPGDYTESGGRITAVTDRGTRGDDLVQYSTVQTPTVVFGGLNGHDVAFHDSSTATEFLYATTTILGLAFVAIVFRLPAATYDNDFTYQLGGGFGGAIRMLGNRQLHEGNGFTYASLDQSWHIEYHLFDGANSSAWVDGGTPVTSALSARSAGTEFSVGGARTSGFPANQLDWVQISVHTAQPSNTFLNEMGNNYAAAYGLSYTNIT